MASGRSALMRPLGQTGLQLSLLGFGAAPIGNLYQSVTDEVAAGAIQCALDAGIRYFDTAPHYGFGLSEDRLGRALSLRDPACKPILSSKVGRLLVPTDSSASVRHGFANAPAFEPVFDYSYDGVMRSFDASTLRLQADHIDILFAHDLGRLTHGEQHQARWREFLDGGYRALDDLRSAGRVKAIGLGVNECDVCIEALAHAHFDCFLLAGRYTLLEQGALDALLPLCAQRQVSIILGGPFNSGILASGVSGPGPFYYNYEPAPDNVIARVGRLENVCREFNVPLTAAALQFPAAHPQICSVIAGFANNVQVKCAAELMDAVIPEAFWSRLRELGLIHADAPLTLVN